MQKDSTDCIIKIKVGDNQYSVHRSILENCSDCFHLILENLKNQNIHGSLRLEGLKENSVQICVNFMYTEDETLITSSNAAEVLKAATELHLRKLQRICFKNILRNLSLQNCIPLFDLACIYDQDSFKNATAKYIQENFSLIVCNTEYQQLSKYDALFYAIQFGCTDDQIWSAASSWIEYDVQSRGGHVVDFFHLMSLEGFPSDNLIRSLWNAKYFRRSDICKRRLFERVFSDVSQFLEGLSLDNWFVLHTMADCCDHVVQEIKDAICQFLLENFTEIANHESFVKVSKEDIVAIFQSPHAVYFSSEKLKWDVMLKWMNGNQNVDAEVFSQLLKTITLNSIPKTILVGAICNEPLFKRYPSCLRLIESAVSEAPTPLEETAIAILYDNDEIDVYEVKERRWSPLHYTQNGIVKMTVLNGHLCLLSGGSLQVCLNKEWVHLASMSKIPQASAKIIAFKDMIFVLEKRFYSFYNSATNSWTEQLVLPWLGDATFYPVAGKNKIYLISSSSVSMSKSSCNEIFEEINIPSGEDCDISSTSSAVYCSGNIYFSGKQNCSKAVGLPEIIKYKIVDKTWAKITFTRRASYKLFMLKHCLHAVSALCSDGMILLEYNMLWDEWMDIKINVQPNSVGFVKRIESVCSFRS